MRCAECKSWGEELYEWYNKARPCNREGEFFVGGGDNNDGLYTEPEFWCKHFEERTANIKEGVALQPTTAQACKPEEPASTH